MATTIADPAPGITFYEVGGCVRDRQLGVISNDIDYSVEASSFEALVEFLDSRGFERFVTKPEYLTTRARFPRTLTEEIVDLLPPNELLGQVTADFVLCRADGTYTDGRRPDDVVHGTIYDDLARRDFTVNAIARRADGTLLDPHDGARDLAAGILRAVGDPIARMSEDGLRALRAVRFAVMKDLVLADDLVTALTTPDVIATLASVHEDRRRKELEKAMRHDTPATLRLLTRLGEDFLAAALGKTLWFKPTCEQ